MKTVVTLSLLFVAVLTMAQTGTEVPRTEFAFNLSESIVSIKPGESKNVTVSVLRSKLYSKAKAQLGFSNKLPEGIRVQYDPAEGDFETSVATITVIPSVAPGIYQIVLNGTLNYKTKGSILKVAVSNESVASK